MRLVGEDGSLILEARGVRLRRVERHTIPVPLSDKLYEAEWQPSPPGGDEASCDGWLVVGPGLEGGPHEGFPERFAQPLAVQAARLHRALQDAGATVLSCGYGDEAELAEAIAALRARVGDGRAGVLFLAPRVAAAESSTGSDVALAAARHVVAGVARTSEVLRRSLAQHGFDDDVALGAGPAAIRLTIVTQGAAAVVDGEPGRPALASLSALSRVLAFTEPGLIARIVDLEPADDPQQPLASLLAELACASVDDEVAWRGGTRYARRLARATVDESTLRDLPRVVRPGSYAISGGLSDQGLQIALWLARGGATRIALAGQRAGTATEQAVLAEIEQRGVEVDVVLGDIADGATARRLVAACTRDGAPLRGVIHAAGAFAQEPASGFCDATQLERVWDARVSGAWHLHEASDGHDLDFWLACSSSAALLGAGGHVATASADAWLDAFVSWRRAHGRVAQTIAWGAWGDTAPVAPAALVDPMTAREGIDALAVVVASRRAATAVMRFDAPRALAGDPRVAAIPLFASLRDGGPVDAAEDVRGHARGTVERLSRTDPAAALRYLQTRLAEQLAAIMGHRVEELDVQAPLTDLGIDSLMATRAKNMVEHDFDLVLPVRRLLQGASLTGLASIVAEELGLAADPGEEAASDEAASARRRYVEPRDPTERWLARIWGEVLERRVGATDRFDELGGGEQAVEAVVARVRARLGPNVDARELFADPSLERQADLLRDALEGNAGAEVRVLRRGGSRPPLFLFHPAGGPASVYEPLVALLAHDQPVYGFERIEEARSVEEKAARYLAMLKEIAPSGPYRLGGWSLGGCVAYEVACQLKQRGDEVELVAMLDTVIPKPTDLSERELLTDRFTRFVAYLQDTYEISLEVDVDALVALEEEDQIQLLLDTLERAGVHMSSGQIAHQRSSYIDSRVAERYRAQPFAGRVVLYRASDRGLTVTLDPRYARDDDACGWDALCTDLEIVHVTGDHTSIIDPPAVGVIASHLQEALRTERVLSREAAA